MFCELGEGQLDHILGLMVITQHTHADAEDQRAVARDDCRELLAKLVGTVPDKLSLV
jgi:hypothetical protein